MRFFETTLELDPTSGTNFFTSCVNIVLVAPFRLTQEVSKKIIYLKHQELETVLFTSAIVSFVMTGLDSVAALFAKSFSLTGGKFPILLQLIASVLLTALYAIFSMSHSLLFDTFESTLSSELGDVAITEEEEEDEDISSELGNNGNANITKSSEVKETKLSDLKPSADEFVSTSDIDIDALLRDVKLDAIGMETVKEPSLDISSIIQQNDTYVAPEVKVQLDTNIINHTHKSENIVSDLEAMGNNCVSYSDAELEALQNRIKATQPEASYFNQEFMLKFALSSEEDEEIALMTDTPDLDEDFA